MTPSPSRRRTRARSRPSSPQTSRSVAALEDVGDHQGGERVAVALADAPRSPRRARPGARGPACRPSRSGRSRSTRRRRARTPWRRGRRSRRPGRLETSEVSSNISRPKRDRVEVEHLLEVLDDRRGRARSSSASCSRTVSESTAQSSIVAVERCRLVAVGAEALDDERRGRADRVERRRDRDARLDRADVMVVEDLDDLGLLDAGNALRRLGVVDEDHPPRLRRDQVGAREQADRPAARRRAATAAR